MAHSKFLSYNATLSTMTINTYRMNNSNFIQKIKTLLEIKVIVELDSSIIRKTHWLT